MQQYFSPCCSWAQNGADFNHIVNVYLYCHIKIILRLRAYRELMHSACNDQNKAHCSVFDHPFHYWVQNRGKSDHLKWNRFTISSMISYSSF